MNHKPIFTIITIIVSMMIINLRPLSADESPDLHFSLFYESSTGRIETVNLNDTSVHLNAGSKLKVYVQPLTEVYFYFYNIDQNDAITVIFPDEFGIACKAHTAYFIPPGNPDDLKRMWWTLDDKGPDDMYVVVSPVRLITLEKTTQHYHNKPNRHTGKKLIQQLQALNKLAERNTAGASIFDIPIEENNRNLTTFKSFRFTVSSINIRELYVKKIKINH